MTKRSFGNRSVYGARGAFGLLAPAAAAIVAWAPPASAQDASVDGEPPTLAPAPVVETTTPYLGPNVGIIAAGTLVFTATYVPVVAVGAGSSLSADKRLYVPVAGPWLDLAQRHVCEAGNLDCTFEIANKLLLAADGIFQGAGVLTAFAGFLVHDAPPVVTTARMTGPTWRIAPVVGGGEMGIVAQGTF